MDDRLRRTLDTYESVAEEYVDRHGGDRDAVADIVAIFLDALAATGDDGDPQCVLDVGCGPGWETATFESRGLDAVGIDLSRAFLDEARDRAPGSALVRADMRSLPLSAGAFDGLWACASLLHVPREDVPATLREFERVLAAEGLLAVSMKRASPEPLPESPYEGDERHFERYEASTLESLLTDAGFAVMETRTSERWAFLLARA